MPDDYELYFEYGFEDCDEDADQYECAEECDEDEDYAWCDVIARCEEHNYCCEDDCLLVEGANDEDDCNDDCDDYADYCLGNYWDGPSNYWCIEDDCDYELDECNTDCGVDVPCEADCTDDYDDCMPYEDCDQTETNCEEDCDEVHSGYNEGCYATCTADYELCDCDYTLDECEDTCDTTHSGYDAGCYAACGVCPEVTCYGGNWSACDAECNSIYTTAKIPCAGDLGCIGPLYDDYEDCEDVCLDVCSP